MGTFEEFLNLLLPARCVLCRALGSPVCINCQESKFKTHKIVSRFNLRGSAICEYTPEVAALIHELKENSQTEITKSMGLAISRALPRECVALVPMPSKTKSFEARGYNPAKLLAHSVVRQIAKSENRLIEVIDCLQISREVQDQAALSGGPRRTNLVGAMSLRFAPRVPVVWLVDDIVTTGATIQEAARCLTEAGIGVGGVLGFAETLPKNRQKAHAKSV